MKKIFYLSMLFLFSLWSCSEEKGVINIVESGFTPHYSDASGIDFCNRLVETEEMNVVNYEYLYNGGGVGIGDFNQDGLSDIFFTGTMVPDQMFISKGDFNFEKCDFPIVDNSGFSTGVCIVDINADGLDDVYICRTGKGEAEDRKNKLYVNKGGLQFEESADLFGIGSDHHTNHAAFFDYDKDGDLDLYLLNHPIDFKNSQKVRAKPSLSGGYERILHSKTAFDSDQLLKNNGDGTFTDISKEAGIDNYGFGLSVTIVDVNMDGNPDIYVANDYIETDILYVSDGKGKFSRELGNYFLHISENSMGADWADLNNDGLEDLIVVDMIAEDNFRQKTLVSSMAHERYHTLKNMNYEPQHMRNVVQMNNGDGAFSEVGHLLGVSNTDWSWAPLIIDLDNDGHKEIFISNGYRRDLSDCDYTLYKSDSLSKAKVKNISEYLENIPQTPIRNYVFKNNGDLKFENYSNKWNLNDKTFSNGSAFADFDNDGRLDIVVNNVDTFPIIYENSIKTDNHFLRIRLEGDGNNNNGVGARLRLYTQGNSQVVNLTSNRGYFSSVLKEAHFGLGKDSQVDSLIIDWPNGYYSVIQDLVADTTYSISFDEIAKNLRSVKSNRPDPIFVAKTNGIKFKHKENKYDDLRTQHLLPHCLSNFGPEVRKSNDKYFLGGAFGQHSEVVSLGGGSQKLDGTERTENIASAFFDADNDGDEDLYVVAGGNAMPLAIENYRDSYYENINGRYVLSQDRIPSSMASGGTVTPLDFDDDGDMDLFVGGRLLPGNYPLNPISYVLSNEQGTFRDVTDSIASSLRYYGMISDSHWADIDGDDQKELIVCGEYLPLSIFEFKEGQFTRKRIAGLEDTHGWWNAMELHDVDKDGDLDIIAGNLGLNAKYKCSVDKPFELYAHDFDKNGRIDPIACQFYGDRSYPIPARGDLLKQLPVLQRRLKNYRKYASCQISDIFSEDELSKAEKFVAKTFASSLFINEDNGFTRVDLPIECQYSPIYSIEVIEVKNEIFLVTGGNNIDAHVESGPYDAGRVNFMRYENGTFLPYPILESGLRIQGEVRSLVYDDKKQELIVGLNDENVQVYRMKIDKL